MQSNNLVWKNLVQFVDFNPTTWRSGYLSHRSPWHMLLQDETCVKRPYLNSLGFLRLNLAL